MLSFRLVGKTTMDNEPLFYHCIFSFTWLGALLCLQFNLSSTKTELLRNTTNKMFLFHQVFGADYMNRSPKEKWKFVRDVGQMFLRFIGVPFLHPTFQVRWYSYVPAVVLMDILLSFFYTVWFYFGCETIKGFLIVSLLGILTSVSFIGFEEFFSIYLSELKPLLLIGIFGIFPSYNSIKL